MTHRASSRHMVEKGSALLFKFPLHTASAFVHVLYQSLASVKMPDDNSKSIRLFPAEG